MDRRQVLAAFASSGSLLAAGCSTLGEQPGPFDFAIVNRRQQSFHVAFTLRHDDETLVDGSADVAARRSDEEYTVLRFDDLARVTNGDVVEAQVTVEGETFSTSYGTSYEVTCNRSENAGNELYFRIREPRATTADSGMGFAGDEC